MNFKSCPFWSHCSLIDREIQSKKYNFFYRIGIFINDKCRSSSHFTKTTPKWLLVGLLGYLALPPHPTPSYTYEWIQEMKKVYALFTFRIDALKAKIIQSKINLHQEDKPTPAFAKDLECTICLEIPKSKPGSQVGEQFD